MDPSDPIIPPDLADAIRRAHPAPILPEIDRQRLDAFILAEARRALRPRRRSTTSLLFRIGLPLTAAACLTLFFWSPWSRVNTAQPTLAFDPTKPDGTTILDAFTLAKLIEQRTAAPTNTISPTWDLTADGQIDQRDVDALAHRAVKLSASPAPIQGGPA